MRDKVLTVLAYLIVIAVMSLIVFKYGWRFAGIKELRALEQRVERLENVK